MPGSIELVASGDMPDTQAISTSDDDLLPSYTSFSPIHSLPDELMSLIFAFAVPHAIFSSMIFPPKEWWSIPWVNRHFRRIALQTPRFWAAPVFKSEGLLDHMLSHSGAAPLTVCFDDRCHGLLEKKGRHGNLGLILLAKALEHLPRIENLTLYGNRQTVERSRQLLEGRDAALTMRHCSITCYEGWDTLEPAMQEDMPRDITFRDDLFDGQAPHLRSLQLHDAQILWTCPILGPSIVTLVLTAPPILPALAAMLEALARMPKLRHLVMLPGLPSDDSSPNVPSYVAESVELPQLRHCIFVIDLEDAQALLEALVMPQTTEMRTICHAPGDMDNATPVEPMAQGLHRWYAQQQPTVPFARLLALRIQTYTTSSWDNLRISTSWEQQPDLLSDSGPSRAPDAPTLAGLSADVVTAHLHGSDLLLSSATVLLRSLPLSNIRELIVDYGLHGVTPAWWRDIAEFLPSLDTVVLHGHNASDSFFEVLAYSQTLSSAGDNDSEALPLFRSVRNVSLIGLDLAYPPRCTSVARGLRQMERAQRKVQTLCLRGCNMPRMRLLELQVHVETMIMDERKREPEPEEPLAWSFRVQDF
ncbi:hypothetical protein PENSPDRAFT_318055 [Peniophora sp. CONT]|nr:hypothetical protein PENSPDRAFT_318055 [Peniophora sp. CONT]